MTVAVNNANLPTILDVMKRTNPKGGIERDIVELLMQENGILTDAVWKAGNLPTGDRITRRSSVPTPEIRKLNRGVAPVKTLTDQVDESVGMMELMTKVDPKLAKLSGDAQAYRASEDMGVRQGFNNYFEQKCFYGDTDANPEEWKGFSTRFSATTAPLYGKQMIASGISASGSDQNEIIGIEWGNEVYCIYPSNDDPGLKVTDMGLGVALDEDGKEWRCYRTWFEWTAGISVRNPLRLVDVYNIDTSAISASSNLLVLSLVDAYAQWQRGGGRRAFYMNRFVQAFLHKQAMYSAANGTLTVQAPAGHAPIVYFYDVPLRISDALVKTGAVKS
jgi:hypothetical protein